MTQARWSLAACRRASASSPPALPASPRARGWQSRARKIEVRSCPKGVRVRTEPAARAEVRKGGVAQARHCHRPPAHERIFALHSPPDRDLAARGGGYARRPARLPVAAGLPLAPGPFSPPPPP